LSIQPNPPQADKFKKDYKRVKKQHKDIDELRILIENLYAREKLDLKYRDHKLFGRWDKYLECHISPDWLLIYRIDGRDLILVRMGSHSDLFR
jgi:mRNA interferase YafQ